MSPRSAETAGADRMAVVGASTPVGIRLRDGLADRGIPGSRVNLYGTTHGEAVLAEYAGEARLIQNPEIAEIAAHEIVFLCEGGGVGEDVARGVRRETVVVDVVRGLPESVHAPLIHPDINPEAARRHEGFLSVPHSLTSLLSEALRGIESSVGIDLVSATIARPAADRGEPGIEELRAQTVALLSFSEVPVVTFGKQLAFNLLTRRQSGEEDEELERSISDGVGELLGWDRPRMHVRLLTAPMFYGHGLHLSLRLRGETSADELAGWVEDGLVPSAAAAEPHPGTPLEAAARESTRLAEVEPDRIGGFSLWLVSGDVAGRSVAHAIRLASILGGS